MNKTIKIAVLIIFFSIENIGYATERWREVSGSRWDSQSAKKLGTSKVRFYYESQIIEEQRKNLVKSGVLDESQANQISTGRYGVVVNCRKKESGFFHVSWLSDSGVPAIPPVDIAMDKIELYSIAPETNMESLARAVCRQFSFKY
jgi:hypothetical protein